MADAILRHVPPMAGAAPVPALDVAALSESVFMSDYVARSRPLLIKGAIRHWPAVRKWQDRDYLKRLCGSQLVPAFPHEHHVTSKRTRADERLDMPFHEALDYLESQPVAAIACNEGTRGMAADLAGFSFFHQGDLAFFYPPFRFFFFRGAGSAWHYHPLDETLMCQVVGPKEVGLLRVDNPHHKALRRLFFTEDYYEDPGVFDGFEGPGLEWLHARVEEGDALYIPPLWWHGVAATADALGVTVPVSWCSPPPVIARAVRAMAAGDADLMGGINAAQLQRMREAARLVGVEGELRAAFDRGLAERLISLT